MNRTILILLIVVGVLGFWAFSSNNTMVELQAETESSWAQVENVYQRRADLIPNLVATAKEYAEFEQSTLTQVSQARRQVSDIVVTEDVLNDPELMNRFQESQNQLSQALSRFLSVSENYPQLQANQNFQSLMAELSGTENRISVERKRFIDAAKDYNVYVRKFPNSIFAGMFGFDEVQTFEAQEGADQAPDVGEMFNQ